MRSNDYLFSDVGIDAIGFHAPRYYLNINDLAESRNVDPLKYTKGLMLKEMRFPEPNEDIISIGLKAGYYALEKGNIKPQDIDALFVGTETATYAVKSVSNIFAELLGISSNCLTQDVYNACAAGTLALLNAIGLIEKGLIKKALVISCDISSYDIGAPSEPTQGSGAIALVISRKPRIAKFSKKFGKVSGNVNDFWRATKDKNANVFGHYSVDTYMNFQINAYDDLVSEIGDFHADYYTFHAPFAKLPLKCMRQIIQKRWISHISNLPKLKRKEIRKSIIKKLDYFLHDLTALPEYIYLKMREKGYTSNILENLSHWVLENVKDKTLPQLRVPSHFGNMYNASVWAQIIYILEAYGKEKDTIYFGSYGSGATCISGLLQIQPGFHDLVLKKPQINDYIDIKERRSVREYELIKKGEYHPETFLGKIVPHKDNRDRGFILHFCDEGCLIPNIKGVNYCPKGHSGYNERFFPFYAVLDSDPIKPELLNDHNYLSKGYVRIADNVKKGNPLEYEIRRIEKESDKKWNDLGLLNWSPLYIAVKNIYS